VNTPMTTGNIDSSEGDAAAAGLYHRRAAACIKNVGGTLS
jgi:hypothetical protein